MAHLLGFWDVAPPQGNTNLCGPAAVVCAGRYLQNSTALSVDTAFELQRLVRQSGVPFSQGGGAPRLVAFAAHLGIAAHSRCAHPRSLQQEVVDSLAASLPVVVQWRPSFMGLAGAFGDWNHWGVVVEWPDDGQEGIVLTDSMMAAVPPVAGLRGQWTLNELLQQGGFSSRVSAVFIG